MAGILTRNARINFATFLKNGNIHVAFATGSSGWDAFSAPYPAYDLDQLDVTAEFVRKKASNVQYCTPNSSGDIITDRGRYSLTTTPTENLYVRAALEPTEYNTQIIREFGVFFGTTVVSGLPGGQELFTPAEVVSKGTLILVRRIAPIQRSSTTRQLCEFILTV